MADVNWLWSTEEVLPSELGAGSRFLEGVLDRLAKADWTEHEIFSVRLAMEEAMVNAMKHGNRLDRGKRVYVVCKLSRERMYIEIADEGPGFEYASVPDCTAPENLERPCGRGLMLMRNFMTRVQFQGAGNCVVMEKERRLPSDFGLGSANGE